MNFKGLLKVCAFLMTGLVAVASATLIAYKSPNTPQQERLIPATVNQLPPANGAFPIEMRCADVRSSAPNELDEFSCLVINNTQKRISALAVEYSIIIEGSGGTERETSLLTYDFASHPDLREAKHLKLLPPGESRGVEPSGPITFESGTVSGFEAQIAYVEFEDKTSIGSNTQGAKMINSMREGAAKYKAWLIQQYKRKGKEVQATASLLEDDGELPKELNFSNDPDLNEGARLYRRIMRSVYTSQGAAELKRYLDK